MHSEKNLPFNSAKVRKEKYVSFHIHRKIFTFQKIGLFILLFIGALTFCNILNKQYYFCENIGSKKYWKFF